MGGEYSFFSQKEMLYSLVEAGDVQAVAQMLKAHPSLISESMTSDNKVTPLVRAVWRRDETMVKLLLGMGADPNSFVQNLTPLMYASYRGCLGIVQLLLQYKAQLHVVTNQDLDALDYAILFGSHAVARFLIDHNGMTPRHNCYKYFQINADKKIYYVDYSRLLPCLKPHQTTGVIPDLFEPLSDMDKQINRLTRKSSVRTRQLNLSGKKEVRGPRVYHPEMEEVSDMDRKTNGVRQQLLGQPL